MQATVSATLAACGHITLTITPSSGEPIVIVTTLEDLKAEAGREDFEAVFPFLLRGWIREQGITSAGNLRTRLDSKTFVL